MRQIVLDTETTGLETAEGHRIIEIGCVELLNRRPTRNTFHVYLQPDRVIDEGAIEVHGISNEFLVDKPRFRDVAEDFLTFIRGAELIIHNAPFDVGFINHELRLMDAAHAEVTAFCGVLDTLVLARRMHPGQKNSLDALCRRYGIDNSHRDLHGALLDAEILADVYLAMTGGQTALSLGSAESDTNAKTGATGIRRLSPDRPRLKVVAATAAEREAHELHLQAVEKASGGNCLWRAMESNEPEELPEPAPVQA